MNYAMLEQALKVSGQRTTTTRRKVYAALHGQEPIGMRELVRRCQTTDRASVYRTVALFERLGIVQRLQSGWKYRLELTGNYHEHHHHATCLSCGKSFVVSEDDTLEKDLQRVAQKIGFSLERHQLELQGYCSDCRNK